MKKFDVYATEAHVAFAVTFAVDAIGVSRMVFDPAAKTCMLNYFAGMSHRANQALMSTLSDELCGATEVFDSKAICPVAEAPYGAFVMNAKPA